jgi:ubiquinol-cytochrome c reductase cytochrome b subunit
VFHVTQVTDRISSWVDEQTRLGDGVAALRARAFPSGRAGVLWQIAVSSFLVCMLSGLVLLFFYDPSTVPVVYQGGYAPLRGVEMSGALQSTLAISFDVPGGLLVRQLHNWSSSLMIAALAVHILSVFFTGAFRRPRELVWLLLFGVLFLTMAAGLTGSVLPDDLLSTNSLAVLDGVLKAIPIVGTWLSSLVFQGRFPSGAIETFYPLHVVALPLGIAALIAAVVVLAIVHGPTRSQPPAAPPAAVGGSLRSTVTRFAGVFFVVFGVLSAIAALVSVNPVAIYGPSDPGNASTGAGAVWYLAFLDGAQRLVPSGWEVVWMDRTITLAILVPVVVSSLFLVVAALWPFAERFIANDPRPQIAVQEHRVDRPRNAATRTALGVAAIVFYAVLWAAAGSDTIAYLFRLSSEGLLVALQVTLVLGPPIAFTITQRICLGLQRKDRDIALHGFETGRIVRMPGGEYVEVHQPVSAAERLRLVGYEVVRPALLRPDARGRLTVTAKVRSGLARWWYGGSGDQ